MHNIRLLLMWLSLRYNNFHLIDCLRLDCKQQSVSSLWHQQSWMGLAVSHCRGCSWSNGNQSDTTARFSTSAHHQQVKCLPVAGSALRHGCQSTRALTRIHVPDGTRWNSPFYGCRVGGIIRISGILYWVSAKYRMDILLWMWAWFKAAVSNVVVM